MSNSQLCDNILSVVTRDLKDSISYVIITVISLLAYISRILVKKKKKKIIEKKIIYNFFMILFSRVNYVILLIAAIIISSFAWALRGVQSSYVSSSLYRPETSARGEIIELINEA